MSCGYIVIKLYPDGRVERSEKAESWREREELIAYSLFLQPALAAIDTTARIWRDLRGLKEGSKPQGT